MTNSIHIFVSLFWKTLCIVVIFGMFQSCNVILSTSPIEEPPTHIIVNGTPSTATAEINQATATEVPSPTNTLQRSCGEINSIEATIGPQNQERGNANILIRESDTDRFSYWLINLKDGSKHRFAEDFIPVEWSPSGQQLLLYQDNGFYLASPDGSNPKLILNIPVEHDLFEGWWLNEGCLLLNISFAPGDLNKQFDPRVYLLDLVSGSFEIVMADERRIIQSVSYKDQIWIQGGGDKVEICNTNGNCTQVFHEYDVGMDAQPKRASRIAFIPATGEVVFVGTEKLLQSGELVGGIYRSTVLDHQIISPQLIYQPINPQSIKISPNSRYIAFAEEIDYSMILTVMDLESLETMTFNPWKEIIAYPLLVLWSPDSSSIALTFKDQGLNVVAVVELASGQITPVYTSNNWVDIVSWPDVELDKINTSE